MCCKSKSLFQKLIKWIMKLFGKKIQCCIKDPIPVVDLTLKRNPTVLYEPKTKTRVYKRK